MSQERVLLAISDAIDRIDTHLADSPDEVLGRNFDQQLRIFRKHLLRFKQAIEAGETPVIDGSMTWAIADSWPYNSSLAKAIVHAEAECKRFVTSVRRK